MVSKKTVILMAGVMGLLGCPNYTSQQVPVIDPARLEQRVQANISIVFPQATDVFIGEYTGMAGNNPVFKECYHSKRAGEVLRFSVMDGEKGDYLVKVKATPADFEREKIYILLLDEKGKIIRSYDANIENKNALAEAVNKYWVEKLSGLEKKD